MKDECLVISGKIEVDWVDAIYLGEALAAPEDGYLLIQADSALPGLGLTCPMVAETIEESMPLPEGTTCHLLEEGVKETEGLPLDWPDRPEFPA